MHLPRMRGLLVIVAAVAVAAGLALPAQAAGPRTTDPTEFTGRLNAVSADSPADAWATGLTYSNDPTNRHEVNLALHWNGTSWSRVSIPTPGPVNDGYYGVTAISPTDAWAVGISRGRETMLMHWDGTSWTEW
jgi:hypothetical protein